MPGAIRDALDLRIRAKFFTAPDGARQQVLHDVRILARPGEVLALLGRSGAGKSTLLRIALGLDPDFEGNITLPCGRIGAVFQEPRLLPWLTVETNLRLMVTKGVPEPDLPALLAAVGLPDAAPLRPGELSLGMGRRVAMARALVVAPALLVLDEPFASLDRQLAATLASVVASKARSHRATVLFATHDLDQALAIADRLLILHGRPATLAADVTLPDRTEATAVARVADNLRTRFAFLCAEVPGSPADNQGRAT